MLLPSTTPNPSAPMLRQAAARKAAPVAQQVLHVLLGEGLGARGGSHGQDGQRGTQVAVRPASCKHTYG